MLMFFISFNCLAGLEYRWIRLNPEDILSGACYEIEKNLQIGHLKFEEISNYVRKVSTDLCRTEKVQFSFNLGNGNCYEVDVETNGNKFMKRVNVNLCRTKNTTYRYLPDGRSAQCHEVDQETLGQKFFKRLNKNDLCINEKSLLKWVARGDKSGFCTDVTYPFSTPPNVANKYCEPRNSGYVFYRTEKFKGYCLHRSMEENNKYSVKVKTTLCRPEKTNYFFFKASGRASGKCYEVDSETRGDRYVKEVRYEYCRQQFSQE